MTTMKIRLMVLAVTAFLFNASSFAGGEEFSKDETVGSISGDSLYPGELQYAVTDWLSQTKVFVAIHGGSEGSLSRAAIYKENFQDGNRGYQLLKRLDGGETSYFEPPRLIKRATQGPAEMIHIRQVGWGTAHITWDFLFVTGRDGGLKQLEIEDPILAFKRKYGLMKGQGVWKGVQNDFSLDEFIFGFHIWNPGDANCCPTGGQVTGTYRINGDRDKLVVDEIHFSPKSAR